MKTCKSCETTKPLSEFYKSLAAADGLTASCKCCITTRQTARIKANPFEVLLYGAKHRAKRDGVPFNLTIDNTPQPTHCPVFGTKLVYGGTGKTRGYGARDDAASIDRIDAGKGYVVGNVNVVSWKANRAKAFLSPLEIQQLAAFYKP